MEQPNWRHDERKKEKKRPGSVPGLFSFKLSGEI
jgi:hypothetical protein